MSNPNNCATCEHKQHPDGGWCYMFRYEPKFVCKQHTPMPLDIETEWVEPDTGEQRITPKPARHKTPPPHAKYTWGKK